MMISRPIPRVMIPEKRSCAALRPCSCNTRIKVGIKATLKEPATTLITNRGRRKAIRKASRQSVVPNHAATVSSLAIAPSWVTKVKRPTIAAAPKIFPVPEPWVSFHQCPRRVSTLFKKELQLHYFHGTQSREEFLIILTESSATIRHDTRKGSSKVWQDGKRKMQTKTLKRQRGAGERNP
jgi:hypothetical protein